MRTRTSSAFILAPLLAHAIPAPAAQLAFGQPPRAPPPAGGALLSAGFEAWATGLLDEWGVPGAAVGVFRIDPDTDAVTTEFVNAGTAGRGRAVTEDVSDGWAPELRAPPAL